MLKANTIRYGAIALVALRIITGQSFAQAGCLRLDIEGCLFEFVEVPGCKLLFAKTELTQKQWTTIMRSNPSVFLGDDLPVENISWNDAWRFIDKLNQKDALKRLGYVAVMPSEEEWMVACGPSPANYADSVWGRRNSERKTHPVATKSENRYGLYDMLGNVYEYCQDKHGEDEIWPKGGCWNTKHPTADWHGKNSVNDKCEKLGMRLCLNRDVKNSKVADLQKKKTSSCGIETKLIEQNDELKVQPQQIVVVSSEDQCGVLDRGGCTGTPICGINVGALVSSLPRQQLKLNKERQNYSFGKQSYDLIPSFDKETQKWSYGMGMSNGLCVHYTPKKTQLDFLRQTSEGADYGYEKGFCLISVFYNNFDRRINGWHWQSLPSSADWVFGSVKRLCEYFSSEQGLAIVEVDQRRSEVTLEDKDGTKIFVRASIINNNYMMTTAVLSVAAHNERIRENDIYSKDIPPVDLLPLAKVVPYPRIPTNPCLKCGGMRVVEKKLPCPSCHGKCLKCKGKGWLECVACKIKGKSFVYRKNCEDCHGKRKIKCDSCENGHGGYCKECVYDGYIKKKVQCPRCLGRGEEF